ncbi:hypothetical protein C0991_009436 [Blastosporella zonata]|nr:hypothetical protein C0991_009436 [Blastosporella zonata]
MDELLHHCLRELSFDGDLVRTPFTTIFSSLFLIISPGCNVSRLRDFIVGFYAHNDSPQNPDDTFCAFVWSLVIQQPTVRVGTVPPGVTSEVWIAPQISAKRKAKAKGEEHIETTPTELDIVPDARDRSLEDLKQEYGDNLRIAVDPDAIYAAITGSHIRFAKLSPMVYSALQIITRGRDNGVTVVQLGQQSKYDQKTCFYLVRQLTDLDLVVKVRRGGVGTHFVIHRHFFDRSPHWKAIREEENQAESSQQLAPADSTTDFYDEEDRITDVPALDFTPIDARHLSSLPLVRGRVVKLLKASKNQMHASNNMLITLVCDYIEIFLFCDITGNEQGFANPTKTDRRFFQSRIREMIQQGVIEKVVVPSNKRKSVNASVKCFRLVSKDPSGRDDEGVIVQPQDGDDDEKDVGEQSAVKMNITIHKQIFDLLEESGMVGMTLNELSAALCQFDKRTIELLLTRAEKFPPPSHLSDLGIAGLMETSGRERRHRYFTVASYRQLLAKERLDNTSAGYTELDFTNVGGFLPVDSKLFYQDQTALHQYQDAFKDEKTAGKKRTPKNPILADGTVKQGRPRKYPVGEDPKALRKKRNLESIAPDSLQTIGKEPPQPNKKRRLDTEGESGMTCCCEQVPKKRGRKGKQKQGDQSEEEVPAPQKKRGRPSKAALEAQAIAEKETPSTKGRPSSRKNQSSATAEVPPTPKKRGRTKASDAASEKVTSEDEAESGPPKRTRFAQESLDDTSSTAMAVDQPDKAASVSEDILTDLPAPAPSPEPLPTIAPLEQPSDHPSASAQSHLEQTELSPAPLTLSSSQTVQISAVQSAHSPHLLSPPLPDTPHDTTSKQHVQDKAVPIDPTLMTDVLAYAQQMILHTSTTDSPLTFLEEQSSPNMPQTFSTSGVDVHIPPLVSEKIPDNEPKQQATPKGSRVNVSHLRRENELYRVVENLGGIVNIQTKDFFEEHIALLEVMTKAGEPTSAPAGTRTDKRTAVSTFNNLEKRGRIKQLRTSVMTHTGVRRPACIVYLPSVSQEKLNAFLADLSRGVQSAPHPGNFVKIDEHVEYGADPTSIPRGALPLQLLQMEQPGDDRKERWSKNVARADQLFSYDDSVIRDVLLTERTTLAQLYGFIVGKAVRSRELHLSTLDAFEKGNTSSNIISHEKRIVDLSFFCHDIPLGLYCSLVSSLSHGDELSQYIATTEGRQTLVRDLPSNINTTLQIGRSRGRSRFLDILETLRALNLATPLQASSSDNPWITCAEREGTPHAFDVASLEGWTVSTPMAAPSYWHFNGIAPLHVWAASEASPPFWQDVPTGTTVDAMNFWRLLQDASTKPDTATSPNVVSTTGLTTVPVSVARSLRRQVSWNSDYILTWHQTQYLRQFADSATGNTPLQDEDEGNTQIEKISWVISAPQPTVRDFYHATHLKLLRDIEKLRKKTTQSSVEKKAKKAAATKASLAKKAADARLQREEEWDALIQRLHPEPLEPAAEVRIRRIRVRFLQAGSTKGLGKWEDEISEAVREASMAAKKILKGTSKRIFPARTVPIPMDTAPLTIAVNPPEKPVQTLIDMQGPPLAPRPEKAKRKRKGKNAEGSLLLLDWAAFEQVFPAVPRNTVRQRLAHIRETPGNEAYLNRLEDRWYEIWMQHRGTPLLPDEDPMSASNFNLIQHVEFLRQHVDKNALRVGFAQPKERAGTYLPASVDILLGEYDVVENTPNVPSWDFVWNAVVEEGREKRMLRQSFLKMPEDMPAVGEIPLEAVSLAESSMKMVLGTPHERYDAETASTLLRAIGEHYVNIATKSLLSRGALSKLVRDPQKQKPGRQLKISEIVQINLLNSNQNALGGTIPRDTFQDAIALEELSLQDDSWREWPLLATDGDSAALIQLVSENKVEFKVDTSHAQSCRPTLDWNSKKADDDQIETAVHVRTVAALIPQPQPIPSPQSSPTQMSMDLPVELNPAHGQSVDGGVASCRRLNNIGLADCMVCLEDEWVYFNDSLLPEERELAMHVLTIVRHGAEHGVTKCHLRMNTNVSVTSEHLFSIVKKMTEASVPMLFWTGYSSLVLVSSQYIRNWTVLISENPATRIFPRRWLDISGCKIVDFWEAAFKAVMGVVVFRPGVTQAELRWRLRSVYDRQEVGDVVRALQEDGSLKMRTDPTIEWIGALNVAALDDREGKGVMQSTLPPVHLIPNHDAVVNMRVKQLWNYVPLPANLKLAWDRITFSRLTVAYFAFSIVHFIIQLSFQVKAFTINADAGAFLNDIVVQGDAVNNSLPILSGNTLHLCSWVRGDLNLHDDSCPVVWNGTKGTNTNDAQSDISIGNITWTIEPTASVITSVSVVTSTSTATSATVPYSSSTMTSAGPTTSVDTSFPAVTASGSSSVGPQTVTVFVRPNPTALSTASDDDDDNKLLELVARGGPRILAFEQDGKISVNVSGMNSKDSIVATLDSSCVWALNWPVSVLDNTKREDIVFIAFQFWVLGMSIVALLNESIPHILASLVTHIMATAWAGFQIKHTADFRSDFTRVITNGACSEVSLLSTYWHDRSIAEVTSLAFNVLALVISSFLTWRLFKLFGWQTFKRVGASLTINRIYKIVLILSITIQLSMFFMAITVSLWIDRLFNSPIGDLVELKTLHKVSSFITLAVYNQGWFAVRRELRVPMIIFLILSVWYLGGWSVMFFSTTFRWNFVTWTFFSIMATASVLLTVASLILGVICRCNFGKGLLRYLNAQQDLLDDNFEYYGGSDVEKVDFPSNEKQPIPTYAAAFGTEAYLTQGPRFSDRSAEPFETAKVTPPPNAYTVARKISDGSSHTGVTRSDTRLSDKSMGTLASFYSYSDKGHGRSDSQKRWVIE